jgi:predicted nucleic acid-binding protein
VIVHALVDFGSRSVPARRVLTAASEGKLGRVQTAWHCCLEFYAVTTRLPDEFRLAPPMAASLVIDLLLPKFVVHDLPASGRIPLMKAAVAERVTGGRLYDSHIAEVARAAGARTIVTENWRDFMVLLPHGIRVTGADDVAKELD